MRKYYSFGELLLVLREEYNECRNLLEELNNNVVVNPDCKHYFSGVLSHSDRKDSLLDRKIRLYTEKKKLTIVKKLQRLRYDWYAGFLYSADFNVEKEENGLYGLKYDNIFTPVDGRKYMPGVEIKDPKAFSEVMEELLSKDLLNTKAGNFDFNDDGIYLGFDNGFITSKLGFESMIYWNGVEDKYNYSIAIDNSPSLIEDIFMLEIPADKISPDWLKLLEKHSDMFEKETMFNVDVKAQSKKGTLKISEIDKEGHINLVNLLKQE